MFEFSSIGVDDVKLSPGLLLLVLEPQGKRLPMRVHSMQDPTISFVSHIVKARIQM